MWRNRHVSYSSFSVFELKTGNTGYSGCACSLAPRILANKTIDQGKSVQVFHFKEFCDEIGMSATLSQQFDQLSTKLHSKFAASENNISSNSELTRIVNAANVI